MKIEREDIWFEGLVRFRTIPPDPPSMLRTVTPKITGLRTVRGGGLVVTITNLLGGSDGQTLNILGDGTTTLKHGTWIFTNTAADKLLVLNKVYRLTYFDDVMKWYEDA